VIELPEGVSKNATRSRSLDVGGRVTVEAARAEVLGLIRMSVAALVRKPRRNRKGDRDVLDKTFLAALASINHPYVSGERDPCRMPAGEEKTRDQSQLMRAVSARDQSRSVGSEQNPSRI